MKFSLDFDGVLTDQSILALVDVDKHWFYWSPQSVAYFPIREGVRQVAALLQSFGDLVILTARPTEHHAAVRAWLRVHAPELQGIGIVTATGSEKLVTIVKDSIVLHVDDDFINSNADCAVRSRVLIWADESPAALLGALVKIVNELFAEAGQDCEVTDLRSMSVTPTFVIRQGDVKRKLKLFHTISDRERAQQFYEIAKGLDEDVFLPAVLEWRPLAMESEFIDGVLMDFVDAGERMAAIPRLVTFLSKLHQCNVSAAWSEQGFSHVSCAIDRFNVLVSGKRLALIDVCDCMGASSIVDSIWAEQLYCTTEEERFFWRREWAAQSGIALTQRETENAMKQYYSWLHYILATARKWHEKDISTTREIDMIIQRRSHPPTEERGEK